MFKKIVLVFIVSILMLSISGCTDDVPTEDLPEGYEFLGSRELSLNDIENGYVSVSGIIGGTEGLYMYQGSTDLYVDIIELDSDVAAEEFILEYKAGFNNLRKGDRFTDVPINGHLAVKILEYVTINTNDVERYSYVWNSGNFVYVVGGATDDSTVLSTLAEAAGN